MSKYNLVLFCKTYIGDLKRVIILKASIDRYNIDKIPLCIVCPKKDMLFLKEQLTNGNEDYNLLFFTDEEVLNIENDNVQNWYTQQVVKLSFYKMGICNYYLMLDSDCYFIQDFEVSDFLYDESTIYLPIVGGVKRGAKYENCIYPPFKVILDFIGLDVYYIVHSMPTLFVSKVLYDFENNFLKEKDMTFEDLIKLSPYEIAWSNYYLINIARRGGVNYIISNPTMKVYHYHIEYMRDRNNGVTVSDLIKEGYVGVWLNNGWVNAKKYKPRFFYKLIKKMNKFIHNYYFRDVGYRVIIIKAIACWIPIKKWREKFRNYI